MRTAFDILLPITLSFIHSFSQTHTHTHAHTHTYTYTHMHIRTYTHTHTHTHAHAHAHVHIHTHTHTCTDAHARARARTHTHTHTRTRTRTRTHTHTPSLSYLTGACLHVSWIPAWNREVFCSLNSPFAVSRPWCNGTAPVACGSVFWPGETDMTLMSVF